MKKSMKIMKRSIVMSFVVTFMCFLPFSAVAADFPNRPVTLICPFGAGSVTDIMLRVLADATSKHLGQPVIVENKSGGAGTVGPAAMAATAKPDGYTIAPILVTVFRYPYMMKAKWDPLNDFTYIIRVAGYSFSVMVRKDAPWKTFNELVAYAKANPGKVTYSTSGAGGTANIAMEVVGLRNGIQWNHVPMKGTGQTEAAVLGGHVMVAVQNPSAALIKSGDLRLLAFFGGERAKNYPDVPTLKELGYNVVQNSPWGLAGPKGMDPKVVKILHDAFKEGMKDPTFLDILDKHEFVSLYMNTHDYQQFVKKFAKEEKENLEKLGLTKK